jgi:Fe-S cluster assembly scaffold protein SufB
LVSGSQLLDPSKLSFLSRSFGEGESALERRKRCLALYQEAPYETDQIFLKNYERPQSEPTSFTPIDITGDGSLLPDLSYNIASVGTSNYMKEVPSGVELLLDGAEGGSKVLPDDSVGLLDKYQLLNYALRNSFHRVVVDKWRRGSAPFTRLTVLPNRLAGLHRRTELNFSKDVACTFVDRLADPNGVPDAGGFMTETVHAYLSPGADVNFVSLLSGKSQVAVNYLFQLAEGARLRFVSWTGGNPYLRSRVKVELRGEGSDAGVFSGNYVNERARHDMLATVEHFGRNTVGLAIQNGVVKSGSRLLVKGMMIIRNPARGSDSHLRQHALLLSHDSYANAIPGLEIETNELKAKHAASVSQPDEEHLFYLMSRGLDRQQAITTVAFGNLGSVITNIADQNLRESVSEEITTTLLS